MKPHRIGGPKDGKDVYVELDSNGEPHCLLCDELGIENLRVETHELELIGIEEKAKRLIWQAVAHDSIMQLLEHEHGQDGLQDIPGCTEEQPLFVASRIDSVANFRQKGRDDLRTDVPRLAPLPPTWLSPLRGVSAFERWKMPGASRPALVQKCGCRTSDDSLRLKDVQVELAKTVIPGKEPYFTALTSDWKEN